MIIVLGVFGGLVMEHVRIRAGRVMVVMVMMAAGHHARHGTER